jgi:hypothetical protein
LFWSASVIIEFDCAHRPTPAGKQAGCILPRPAIPPYSGAMLRTRPGRSMVVSCPASRRPEWIVETGPPKSNVFAFPPWSWVFPWRRYRAGTDLNAMSSRGLEGPQRPR